MVAWKQRNVCACRLARLFVVPVDPTCSNSKMPNMSVHEILIISRSHLLNDRLIEYSLLSLGKIEPPHDKTNKMACAPSEDSD